MNKKKLYCSNCNKYGHTFKDCDEPIISAGIICVKLDNLTFKINIEDDINFISNDLNLYNYQRLSNLNKIKLYIDKVKFLLVQRKHSLNYINFVRGLYDKDDIDQLKKMFSLMCVEEIENIYNKDFETLWCDLWKKTAKKKIYQKEYNESKNKFNYLKEKNYIKNFYRISTEYKSPEWEFPKGRKNSNETNYDCAIREFYEETGIKKECYDILNNINSVHDNFIGTNGLNYKHIFYVGLMNEKIDKEDIKSVNEINEIRWCNWDEAIRLIRPYYLNRINILNKLFLFLINIMEEKCNVLEL